MKQTQNDLIELKYREEAEKKLIQKRKKIVKDNKLT